MVSLESVIIGRICWYRNGEIWRTWNMLRTTYWYKAGFDHHHHGTSLKSDKSFSKQNIYSYIRIGWKNLFPSKSHSACKNLCISLSNQLIKFHQFIRMRPGSLGLRDVCIKRVQRVCLMQFYIRSWGSLSRGFSGPCKICRNLRRSGTNHAPR